jgi:hypothetical protein
MRESRAAARHWKELVWYTWTWSSGLIAIGGFLAYLLGYNGILGLFGL